MASVNMKGCRYLIKNHIQDEIRAGGDVSHILNVKVANEKNCGVVKRLLKGSYSVPRTRPKAVIDVNH
jgi:hypothetical protein